MFSFSLPHWTVKCPLGREATAGVPAGQSASGQLASISGGTGINLRSAGGGRIAAVNNLERHGNPWRASRVKAFGASVYARLSASQGETPRQLHAYGRLSSNIDPGRIDGVQSQGPVSVSFFEDSGRQGIEKWAHSTAGLADAQ